MAETTLTPEGKVTGPRGAKAFKKWVPKEWRPEYEIIVLLSCTGLPNEEVGRRTGYGKQQVSNILNTPQARKVRELVIVQLRDRGKEGLQTRLDTMADKAMSHIERVLDIPSENFKNPLAIFDRSVTFLKAVGKVKGDENSPHTIINNTNNTIDKAMMVLSPDQTKQLADGLKKANEVHVIHDGTIGHNKLRAGEVNG